MAANVDYSKLDLIALKDLCAANGIDAGGKKAKKADYVGAVEAHAVANGLDYEKLKVKSLKDLLRVRKIDLGGKKLKGELVGLLKDADGEGVDVTPAADDGEGNADGGGAGGPVNAQGGAEIQAQNGDDESSAPTDKVPADAATQDAFPRLATQAFTASATSDEHLASLKRSLERGWQIASDIVKQALNTPAARVLHQQQVVAAAETRARKIDDAYVQLHEYEARKPDASKDEFKKRPRVFVLVNALNELCAECSQLQVEVIRMLRPLTGESNRILREYLSGIAKRAVEVRDMDTAKLISLTSQLPAYNAAIAALASPKAAGAGGQLQDVPRGLWLGLVKLATAHVASAALEDEMGDIRTSASAAWDALGSAQKALISKRLIAVGKCSGEAAEAAAHVHAVDLQYVRLEEYPKNFDGEKGPVELRPTFWVFYEALKRRWRAERSFSDAFLALSNCTRNVKYVGADKVQAYLREETQSANDAMKLCEGTMPTWSVRLNYSKAIVAWKRTRLSPQIADTFDAAWYGGWPIGGGSFGAAYRYIKRDHHGRIIDRVAVKDSFFDPEHWNDASLWSKLPANEAEWIPNEYLAMYSLRGKVGSNNVVRIRNWRPNSKEMMHRCYMEYCSYGDLHHLRLAAAITRHESHGADQGSYVPEPFMWHVFESLVNAGLLMQHGELDMYPVNKWTPIVHRDVKVENVFLDLPANDNFPSYPTIKLADFGFAVFIPPNDNRRPRDIKSRGTIGCMPAEQLHHKFDGEQELRHMDEKTNVWAVAHVIWELIVVNHIPRPVNYSDVNTRQPQFPTDDWTRATFSPALQGILQQCMSYHPDDRPTFQELRNLIRSHTSAEPNDYTKRMRRAEPRSVIAKQHPLPRRWQGQQGTDKYAIGLAPNIRVQPPPPTADTGLEPGGKPGEELGLPTQPSVSNGPEVNTERRSSKRKANDLTATEELPPPRRSQRKA